MSSHNEEELLQRARAGDPQALGELLREHTDQLEQMARQQIGERLQARLSAADLVQRTCLSVIRGIEGFQGDNRPQFAAWLRGIHERNVRDAVRHHIGAKKRAVSAQVELTGEHPHDTSAPTPSRLAVLGESTEQVLSALQSLPQEQAEAIRLRHLEQLSLREIAAQLQRSEVAVASLLKRGLASLRTQLQKDSGEF